MHFNQVNVPLLEILNLVLFSCIFFFFHKGQKLNENADAQNKCIAWHVSSTRQKHAPVFHFFCLPSSLLYSQPVQK